MLQMLFSLISTIVECCNRGLNHHYSPLLCFSYYTDTFITTSTIQEKMFYFVESKKVFGTRAKMSMQKAHVCWAMAHVAREARMWPLAQSAARPKAWPKVHAGHLA